MRVDSKFYLTIAAGSAALWSLLVVMIVTSEIGLFYYFRIVVVMFMQPATEGAVRTPTPMPFVATLTPALLTVLFVWVAVYPASRIGLIHAAVAGRI